MASVRGINECRSFYIKLANVFVSLACKLETLMLRFPTNCQLAIDKLCDHGGNNKTQQWVHDHV